MQNFCVNNILLILFLLFISIHTRTCVTANEQQQQQQQKCETTDHHDVEASSTLYIRDSPLHTKLVDDTIHAIQKLDNKNNRNNKQKQYYYRPRYFEGWYYKIDLKQNNNNSNDVDGGTFVVIPGLYIRQEEQHGFVMILDATTASNSNNNHNHNPTCYMYRFPTFQNITSKVDGNNDFIFQLDDRNIFTAHGFTIDLPASSNNPAVVGSAYWQTPLPLPSTFWNPTIMGWFSYLPRGMMQCSHGVVSMDHTILDGHVTIIHNNNNRSEMTTTNNNNNDSLKKFIDLTGSQGYVEKDWGREFPERYTWIQANDFRDNSSSDVEIPGASFLVSVASIPVKPFEKWLNFTGFLSFLRYPDKDGIFQTIRFATYTGAKVSYSYNITQRRDNNTTTHLIGENTTIRDHTVVVVMTNSRYNLTATVTGDRDNAATLWGPLPSNPSGGMQPYVREMLNCPVNVVLTRRKDNIIVFQGTALHGGFEIEGHEDYNIDDEQLTCTSTTFISND